MILPDLLYTLERSHPPLPESVVDVLQQILQHSPDVPEEMLYEIGAEFTEIRNKFLSRIYGLPPEHVVSYMNKMSDELDEVIFRLSRKYNYQGRGK